MGGVPDTDINKSKGPYVFRISGQNHHSIGSLLPVEGRTPKFVQLYIYDTENEVANRLNAVESRDDSTGLNPNLVEALLEMLDENNELAKVFRMARDRFKESDYLPIRVRLLAGRSRDSRQYNLPTCSEVAALIVGDFEDSTGNRDIVVEHKTEGLKRILELHPSCMAMNYPLLFPYGEDGYHERIKYSHTNSDIKRKYVTMCEFYAYRIQQRLNDKSVLLWGGRLLLQYIVDAYTCIEEERLRFCRNNQKKLRSELYEGLKDALTRGDNDPTLVGKRILLLSSFTGGPRYKVENYQDAMAICRVFGNPDLFITFTANPNWPEIQSMLDLIPGTKASERPDIVVRVFKMKLDELMYDLVPGQYFGKVIAALYTIEFQKRGLPHAHIILTLHPDNKITTTEDVDRIISAELPDPVLHPQEYATVVKNMIHGPCGQANKKAPCMVDGTCSKRYPREFTNSTIIDEDGYPIYRRRDNGHQVIKGGIKFDNRDVVPHNVGLILKYQAHINVEWCNKSHAIKNLFKYINKGPDRGTFLIEDTQDEIKAYLNCRYVSACEAMWRIFQFDINYRTPAVQRLPFHLPDKHIVTFSENRTVSNILNIEGVDKTIFTEWLKANTIYPEADELTYAQFPEIFIWHSDLKEWKPRKQGKMIGRMIFAHPTTGEHFYLRMLLNVVKGPTTYEEIRTFEGTIYPTFRAACYARGMLEGDGEWNDAIKEASIWASAAQLRQLFVTMLVFCEVCEPFQLWENNWSFLSDDVLYNQRRLLNYCELQLTKEQVRNYALLEIEKLLREKGKSLKEYPPLPLPDNSLLEGQDNRLIREQLYLNRDDLAREHEQLHANLNEEQAIIYKKVIDAVSNQRGGLYFVYGHGGTGKTFLYRAIISRLRSEGEIVLAVASSGIASLLLPLGRTAHSRFEIPIDLKSTSTCNIKQGTQLAELIRRTKLIVWDEAPMAHRHCFEALDKSLRDILRSIDGSAEDKIFGGKTILLGGDVRQILPVVARGRREDIVQASITKSELWQQCQVLTLSKNMRLMQAETRDKDKIAEFSDWILSIGEGSLPSIRMEGEEATWIEIPQDLIIDPKDDKMRELVSTIYPQLQTRYKDPKYLCERCILAPKNEIVNQINDYILQLLPEETKTCRSSDTICKNSGLISDQDMLYPVEFLNKLKFNGIPDHELHLKVGAPIILLRNLDQKQGLCNGTRLIITHLASWIIEAEIITGKDKGKKAYIPRVIMTPTDSKWTFTFKRRQFPVRLCYAMTINKSQGQTLKIVALYLPQTVFSHGQLYVVVSRVTSREGLKILIDNQEYAPSNCYTRNIIYKKIFEDLPAN